MTTDTTSKVEALRKDLGSSLTIMGHHYQNEAVIRHTDLRGDSLELARRVADVTSENIVFCGVFFMAESAALLARPGQKVFLPDPEADCSMAQMAPARHVRSVMEKLTATGKKVVPLAYVNTSLAVKDVVGAYGGAVCTSANAQRMLDWAFQQGDSVLFLPDKCLGANVANKLGLRAEQQCTIDIRGLGANIDMDEASKAKLLLWPGHCCIHTRFTVEDILSARNQHPGCLVVVHPESNPSVVDASDAAGSTSYIIQYVQDAPAGSTVIIGTEINLVQRLAEAHKGRVKVVPLKESACGYMARVTEECLLETLMDVKAGDEAKLVEAPEAMKENAKATLERMLAVCS